MFLFQYYSEHWVSVDLEKFKLIHIQLQVSIVSKEQSFHYNTLTSVSVALNIVLVLRYVWWIQIADFLTRFYNANLSKKAHLGNNIKHSLLEI